VQSGVVEDPTARLETSCTRTGRPRRFLWRILATGRRAKAQAARPAMHVCEGSHRGIVPMNHSNKDGASSAESEEGRLRLKENTLSSDTHPTQSGTACVPRVGECADKRHIGRYSSARRTGCAKERSSGSVRGAPGNRCPYRDRQLRTEASHKCGGPIPLTSSHVSLSEWPGKHDQ
jgi:hypothetical protein